MIDTWEGFIFLCHTLEPGFGGTSLESNPSVQKKIEVSVVCVVQVMHFRGHFFIGGCLNKYGTE